MNEEVKQIVRGALIKKDLVLSQPDTFRDVPLICLRVDPRYLPALVEFSQNKKVDLGDLEIHLFPGTKNITERAAKFFFQMRDKVADLQGDDSQTNKDLLYRFCIESLGFLDHGVLKNSIKQLNRWELWKATELMYEWLTEAALSSTGENISAFIPTYNDIAEDLRE